MKIKRFNEDLEDMSSTISLDRVNEISNNIKDVIDYLSEKKEFLIDIINEFDNYKTKKKSNNQIDDAISNLQLSKSNVSDTIDNLDNVINDLKSYSDNGEEFLY